MILNNVDNLIQITENIKEKMLHKLVEFGIRHVPNKVVGIGIPSAKHAFNIVEHLKTKAFPSLIKAANIINKPEWAEKLNHHHKKLSEELDKIHSSHIKEILNSDAISSLNHHMGDIVSHTQRKFADDYAEAVKNNPDISPSEAISHAKSKIADHVTGAIKNLKTQPVKIERRDLTGFEKAAITGAGVNAAYDLVKNTDRSNETSR